MLFINFTPCSQRCGPTNSNKKRFFNNALKQLYGERILERKYLKNELGVITGHNIEMFGRGGGEREYNFGMWEPPYIQIAVNHTDQVLKTPSKRLAWKIRGYATTTITNRLEQSINQLYNFKKNHD